MLALVLSVTAFAQATNQPGGQDLEYRQGKVQGDSALRVGALLETQWHEYDNLDFRPLDETSDQAILDSDDRGSLAFSGAALDLEYDVDDHTTVAVSASLRGLWGGDQIGQVSDFNSWIYFNNLYVQAYTGEREGLSLTVGRQYFEIGGLGGTPDYVFADVVDWVRADVPIPGFGRIILVPINVAALSADDQGPDFVSYIGQSDDPLYNMRGDRLTKRAGLVVQADDLPIPIEARAYAFYTDIGASGSGSDISYEGGFGNFSDNDWVANAGVRAQGKFGNFKPYASFDLSAGIDRKELDVEDVDAFGFAWGGGLAWRGEEQEDGTSEGRVGFDGQLTYFDCLGAAYAENGLQYSHGYVSMKGRQVGGLIMNRYLGWHPTAYVGSSGISDTPQETDRKSGTRVLNAGLEYAFPGPFSVGVGYWYAMDTGITYLQQSGLDTIQPPYGYSREEFAAEARLGQALGQELDVIVGAHLSKALDLNVTGAALLPGAFYATPIERVAGSALGSDDPATALAVSGGTRVRF